MVFFLVGVDCEEMLMGGWFLNLLCSVVMLLGEGVVVLGLVLGCECLVLLLLVVCFFILLCLKLVVLIGV